LRWWLFFSRAHSSSSSSSFKRYYVKHHSLPPLMKAGLKHFKVLIFDEVSKIDPPPPSS
jgi:hypothetical protein